VAFQLRDAVNELEGWARGARGYPPSYLESLRVLLDAFLRTLEYLGVPRQRHPAQKLALRALVTGLEDLDTVESVRTLGGGLGASNLDDAAWQLANEAVRVARAMEELRRERPIFSRVAGLGQPERLREGGISWEFVDIMRGLQVTATSAPLLGILVHVPEVQYQAALAYCELGEWTAAKDVLANLRIVGTNTDETFARATSLHRAVALVQASGELRSANPAGAVSKLDEALQELDANPKFRHEFREIARAVKERKTQLLKIGPRSTYG
jgi:hypothetical protein